MKKSNLVKLFSILLMSVMIMLFSTNVLAADENGFNQLTLNSGSNTNTTNTNNTGNTSNTSNTTTNTNNTNNSATNNTNTNRNNTNNTNNNSNNNSSVYNNTNLPKTGIEDSIPVAMLVVIFGISAVYAYKKIKDYRDI